jgi:hypothetical protein
MITANGIKGKFVTYKGLPLVRQDNEIYYGDLSDKHYLFMMIMGSAKSEKFGIEIPNKVMIQVLTQDGRPVAGMQKVVSSLSEAFEYGCPWLERANRE